MKNKKLLITISALVLAAALMLCASALFSVADITIEFSGVVSLEEDRIAVELEKYEGSGILFLKKEKIIQGLQEKFPYVKVKEVVKSFPNRLKIKIEEREELLTVESGGDYYTLSSDGTVLAKKESNVNNLDGGANTELACAFKSLNAGNKAEAENPAEFNSLLSALDLMLRYENTVDGALISFTAADIRFMFKKVWFFEDSLRFETSYGVEFVMTDCTENAFVKMNALLTYFYNETTDIEKTSGYIMVIQEVSGLTVTQSWA